MMNALLFWMILLLVFMAAYALGARRTARRLTVAHGPAGESPPAIPPDALAALETRLTPMLAISGHKVFGNVVEFTGHLKGKTDEMFRRIRESFAADAVTPMLLEGEEGDVRLVVLPGRLAERAAERPKWALHWLLFFATLATTTWAGALHAGVNLLQEPQRFAVGLPYSLGLLLILGSHELGHYFTARAHGIRVTPPYFIPVPFALCRTPCLVLATRGASAWWQWLRCSCWRCSYGLGLCFGHSSCFSSPERTTRLLPTT